MLLPVSTGSPSKGQRVSSITLLAMGMVQTAQGLHYAVQQDYDLWKIPASSTTEPGCLDPRWPSFNQTGRKAKGRGDVLAQAINLFCDMTDTCRQIDADSKDLFRLDVSPALPIVFVTLREEPSMPARFSSHWIETYTQANCEKQFANHVIPPGDVDNPTGFWLAPVGAYAELPAKGSLYEAYHSMPESQVLYRAGAYHELFFERGADFSGVELDLTQRKFSKVPKASAMNIGGATLQHEDSPSEPIQLPSS